MSQTPPPLRLIGIVGVEERPVLLSAARQLAACIGTALGAEWSLRLSHAQRDVGDVAGAAIIVSLLGDLHSDAPVEAIAARWEARVAAIAAGGGRIVVPTLYRHVADPALRERLVVRIRRLNALVMALSRTHGVEVADVDRGCAMIGAGVLAGDYRCAGPRAELVAGHILASALLAAAPGFAPELLERARAAHGTMPELVARHARRAA